MLKYIEMLARCKLKFFEIYFSIKLYLMKNSKAIQNRQKIQSKSLSYLDRISQADYEQLKQTFDLFDQDQGGTIDPTEIQKILQQLGLAGRSKIVFQMINGLKQLNRPIKFDEFLEIVCSKVGDNKSKQGISKIFDLWDNQSNGVIDFHSFKRIAKQLGETLNDDQLYEMMHNSFILNNTDNHENFNFDEFYGIVTKKHN